MPKGHVVFIISKIDVTLFDVTLLDIYIIYLIHIHREGTVVNGRSTACHGLTLVLDLNQKVLNILVFLSNSSFYLSVFVLEPKKTMQNDFTWYLKFHAGRPTIFSKVQQSFKKLTV